MFHKVVGDAVVVVGIETLKEAPAYFESGRGNIPTGTLG